MEWIKQHPYLTGGGILAAIVLFLVLRSASNSSSAASQSVYNPATDPNVLAAQVAEAQTQAASTANTQQLQAAVNAQQIQANAAITVAQLQAQAATTSQQSQDSSALSQTAYAAQVAALQSNNALALGSQQTSATQEEQDTGNADSLQALLAQYGATENIQDTATAAGVTNTGIQAQVAELQSNNELAAQQDIDSASVQTNAQNGSVSEYLGNLQATVTNNQTAATLAGLLNTNATNLAVVNSNNGTTQYVTNNNNNAAVNIAGLQANTQITADQLATGEQNEETAATQSLYSQFISANQESTDNEVNQQFNFQNNVLNAIKGTNFNLGGEGGLNTAGVYESLLGQGGAATAAENATGAANTSSSIGSFLNGLANVFRTAGPTAVAAGV
jgi:hypothetical protein